MVLGSAYTLGRSMVTEPAPRATGASTTPPSRTTPTSPPESSRAIPERPRASAPAAGPDGGVERPARPASAPGLFGARRPPASAEVALTFDDGPDPRYTPQVLAAAARSTG